MIKANQPVFNVVQKLLGKIQCGLRVARLRKLARFAAIQMNETLWSSVFNMLKRYIRIRDTVRKFKDAHVDSLIPSQHRINRWRVL